MNSENLVCSLTNALITLMLLVCMSLVLLLTSAFLYPGDEPVKSANPDWEKHDVPAMASVKSAALTEQQQQGKQLYVNNCVQCHAVTEEIVVGPGLKGIASRTPGEAWLLAWIRNSQAVVASGDPYAVQIYNKFQKIQMSSFTNLTDTDIKAILAYVDVAGGGVLPEVR